VTVEDNRKLFPQNAIPECARNRDNFMTHNLLFATADRRNLTLYSWNCSSGFVNQDSRIANLLKPNRTYLGLASTDVGRLPLDNQRVYVMFDQGAGPQVEEWEFPSWKLLGEVPINLS
jgi:hypothetical protein